MEAVSREGKKFLEAVRYMTQVVGFSRLPDGTYAFTHPIMVAGWLGKYGADERTQEAAVFHNLLYRPDPWLDEESIKISFGEEVLAIVKEVAEPDISVPWLLRKRRLLANLQKRSLPALEIIVADRFCDLINLESWLETEGRKVVKNKMRKAGKDWKLNAWFHYELNRRIRLIDTWGASPCLEKLSKLHYSHCRRLWPLTLPERRKIGRLWDEKIAKLKKR